MLTYEGWMISRGLIPIPSGEEIASQIDLFRSKEGFERQRARRRLTRMGKRAVPALIECLHDRNDNVRWEAARTLKDLPEPSAAEALVNTLTDPVPGVRWLSAEALIELEDAALVPLLQGLLKHFHSVFFRESAHHVLHSLEREGLLNESLIHVLDTLRNIEPQEIIPLAAYKALASLSGERVS
jgi:HEAT repeat protein